MGIIKAAIGAIGGTFADQWLETIEPYKLDNSILATYGVSVKRGDSRGSNKRKTEDVISNGSIIHVPENVYMLLTDGGKIVSVTDEPGYYQVDNSKAPSLFYNDSSLDESGYTNTFSNTIKRQNILSSTIKESWERFKFGGTTPVKQRVIYINKQEIPNIRFGTKNPVPYTDRVLVPGRVVPCKVTSFGTYSIKIADPILFYSEVCSKTDKINLETEDMAEQYINEFLMAYTTALAGLSANFVLVSDIPVKTMELGQYMAEILDNEWLKKRGFYIHSVGIAGISYDEKTEQLLDKYANDSILMDQNARNARMAGSIAAGIEAAGSNRAGSMVGFAGVNMGMNAAAAMGMAGQQGGQQQSQTASGWQCTCGNSMLGEAMFCSKCGNKRPSKAEAPLYTWTCASCGKAVYEGNFCPNCGAKRSVNTNWKCSCGNVTADLFCSKCGSKKPEA